MTHMLWQKYMTHRDDDSFTRVFEAEKDVVWTICARYLGAGEDAEEAFQCAWARLIAEARAGQFIATAAQDHLCRTAGREADALRKRRARLRTRETTMEQPPERIDASRSPAESLTEAERRAAVEALVAQLPEKLRLPVQLHYLNGLTQRQVAATLGVPPSTIDSRLKTAREQLRPLAERAGLRDALTALAAGAMSAGLLSTPASLTATSVLSASVGTTVVAAGLLSTTAAKVVAAAAVVVVAVGIGVGVLWLPKSVDALTPDKQVIALVSSAEDSNSAASGEDLTIPNFASRVAESTLAVGDVDAIAVPDTLDLAETSTEQAAAEITEAEAPMVEEPTADEPETRFMSILVVDAESGEPIAAAEGRVRARRYNRPITTNAEGIARLDDVPLGRANIDVGAMGYAMTNLFIDVHSTDPVVTIELRPGSVLFGIVQNETGTPVSDARVTVSNTLESWNEEVKSDAEGRYEVRGVARGNPLYQVYVNHPGYKTYFRHEKVIVPENADRHQHDIILEAMDNARVTGVVVDVMTGRPIANAILRGSQQMDDDPIGRTDTAGRFAIESFTASNNQILFVADGYAPRAVSLDTAVEGRLRVELERGLVAAGTLVDEQNEPVEGVRINVWAESMHNIASGVTDERGRFSLGDLDAGAVLWIQPPWSVDFQRFDGLAGKTNERIVLPRFSPVTGRVVDAASGKPLEQFRVRLGFAKRTEPGDTPPRGIITRLIDPGMLFDTTDGVFRIGTFPPNTVLSLNVEAEGYATVELDRIVVNPDGELVTIRMGR